ncbi:MAG: hypothetical protein KKG60_03090 [Nanoarchaeota archaeon]|nr:hypothetical protein [Nanoarchaeota archaeon]
MTTPLGNAIDFLKQLGFFDVVLPFLLVFTIVFAILEKSRILGTVKLSDGTDVANKNLNSVVAFVIGMLVVATANVVSVINEALPKVILLFVFVISFLMLIGILFGTGELNFYDKHKALYFILMALFFIGVVGIFLSSIKTESGESWLEVVFGSSGIAGISGDVGAYVILVVIIAFVLIVVTRSPKKGGGKEKEEKK